MRKNKKNAPVSDDMPPLFSYLSPKEGRGGKKEPYMPYLVSFIHEDRELRGARHAYTACSDKKWSAPGKKVTVDA